MGQGVTLQLRRGGLIGALVLATMATEGHDEHSAAIATLGDTHASLRLWDEGSRRQMRASLERHGQLTALCVYRTEEHRSEIVDGFKRLWAARDLGWKQLRVRTLGDDVVKAASALVILNEAHGLTELEEGWICRLLHCDHGLPQHEVGRWLGRHKSWVCRRLLLVQALDESVQAQVRLGLLAPRTAVEVARLPRGNQAAAAEVVIRRGLTTAQTAHLVRAVLACPDASMRAQRLTDALTAPEPLVRARAARKGEGSAADALLRDIDAAARVCARLQARLRDIPMTAWEPRAVALLLEGMRTLSALSGRLHTTLDLTLSGKDLRCEVLE